VFGFRLQCGKVMPNLALKHGAPTACRLAPRLHDRMPCWQHPGLSKEVHMRNRTRLHANLWAWLTTLLIAFALGGCSTIKLVGDYDEQIDNGVIGNGKLTQVGR
jgi:hypothetical protein